MEVEQQPTGVPDGWEVISASPAKATPPSDARPSVSARAGVPAAGRGSQINPEQSMRGLELATTPLAHPTGIDMIDDFTSPVGLASLAAGGAGIARAGLTGGIAAGAKEGLATAAPVIKYEATRTMLRAMKVPDSLAIPIAMVVSGYKKGAKPEPVAEPVPTAAPATVPGTGTSMVPAPMPAPAGVPVASAPAGPMPPSAAAPPPMSPVVPGGQSVAPPPMPEAPASAPPPMNNLPDQRALNDAALAARRASYQARSAQPPPAPVVPAKPMLLASEAKAYIKLLESGKTAKEAMEAIVAQRAFQAQFGLTTPTAAETKFPKGQRGGTQPLKPLS